MSALLQTDDDDDDDNDDGGGGGGGYDDDYLFTEVSTYLGHYWFVFDSNYITKDEGGVDIAM